MKIVIGADLVPTSSNEHLFNTADVKELVGEQILNVLNESDIRIFNLEVPLVDDSQPIIKCGPNLIASTSTIKGIKALNPSLLTLANNHILDQGYNGLESTENLLNKNKIPFIGAGKDIYEACKPYIFKFDEHTVGIYACAEQEFSIATNKSPGANPFDPFESLDHIEDLKNKCDYVIVLYHGGKEHYQYPSPYLQKLSRKMVEKGANLVICQHSHCIGCIEEYRDSMIVYGQGNFIFDGSNSEYWQNSLLVSLELTKEGESIEFIPIVKKKNIVRIADEVEGQAILSKFYKRSDEIKKEDFIELKYKGISHSSQPFYIGTLAGYSRYMAKINQILCNKLIKIKYNKKKLLMIKNHILCESHRELLIKTINEIIGCK